MKPQAIVSAICDEADEFLDGVTKRDEAKAGIAEWLTIHHRQLAAADRKAIIDQAMQILGAEGFFERDAGRDE